VAAAVLPGVDVAQPAAAFLAAALIAVLNVFIPPLLAALRLPYTIALGFLLALFADAAVLMFAAELSEDAFDVGSFPAAFAAGLVIAAVSIALEVALGINDEDVYTLRVIRRIARRSRDFVATEVPGIIYLEIDGLALPVLRRAMRDGNAPEMARWVEEGSHHLDEWETDLSSQTGASQAGILLGSNHDIPAFRWVEKETATLMTCSAPPDCEELERRHSCGRGLLRDGGASRGNLLSGEAERCILTISRLQAERRANPDYRPFFANGFSVTRVLVLFLFEVVLEWTAALRAIRRDVRPRGHRGGSYPFLRAGVSVVVRDLVVFSVLSDMMTGRPAVYATFAGYDEVAHHSGVERADSLEVLRKIDQQFGRITRARQYAPRPYQIVVLSDHGQTQGATFAQRNGYGLADLVRRSLRTGQVAPLGGGDENDLAVARAFEEATGRARKKRARNDVSAEDVVVLGSGNLGLVYLMEERRRLTLEEIDQRHPELLPALRTHPHVGWVLVHSDRHGPVALGPRGALRLGDGSLDGEDPLAGFSPTAAGHLLRADGFPHAADIVVNGFYDPQLDESCAFEELISFHGGMGGPQTRAIILHPVSLPLPAAPVVGAEALHEVLWGWRMRLQGDGSGGPVARASAPREAASAPREARASPHVR
jgi:uncharacterized membrane protein YvlD (DUF360 family)